MIFSDESGHNLTLVKPLQYDGKARHTVVLRSLHTPSLNCIFSCFQSEQIKKRASQSQEQILCVLLSIS